METEKKEATRATNIGISMSVDLLDRIDKILKSKKYRSRSDLISTAVIDYLARRGIEAELGIKVPECCPPTGGEAKTPAPGRSDSARQPSTKTPENGDDGEQKQ